MPTIKATAETRARSGYAAPAPAFPIKLMFDNTGFAMRLPEIEMPMAPVVFMIGSSKPTPRPILSVLNQEQQPMMTAATGPQTISNDTLAELMEYTSRPIVLSMGGGGEGPVRREIDDEDRKAPQEPGDIAEESRSNERLRHLVDVHGQRRANRSSTDARAFRMERATGIGPASEAWEASILPMNYARDMPS